MTPERWRRIQHLFACALELNASARDAFLDAMCAADPALRDDVDSLLAAHAKSEGFSSRATVLEDLPLPNRLSEGTVVDGKYRIDEPLGAGGMGAVYRASHLQLERTVALKVIRADLLSEPAMAERFRREAVAVARLRHPNIVTVFDYGVAAGVGAYIVMECLRGHSLRLELERRARLEVREALVLIGQVIDAIAAAHEAGIVHRDLKPENIFLEAGRRGVAVKVLDFGLAQFTEGATPLRTALTLRGAALGTPTYMAPEQCRGEEADARSDVYALGCLVYEMLTGRPPFVAPTVEGLLYLQVHEPPRPPGELLPEIDPPLEKAILRALAKAPGERHQSANAFARALGLPANSASLGTLAPGGVTVGPVEVLTDASGMLRAETSAAPNNLPRSVTRFVGREREIADVRGWLERTRAVTLVGPGGIGKTRLALETASLVLGEYRDGVWLVELAALADPPLVGQAVASVLGVREQRERSTTERLAEALEGKQVLLVLDNCEHLVDACARLVAELLAAAPGLRVLATSREPLGVPGEAVWPVPALDVSAGADEALECEAVALFRDRASLARPGFETTEANAAMVATLCQRLDGNPLAIELAAARMRVLSVEEILERLDDRFRLLSGGQRAAPPRHQAMRATLDWSYDLLTDEERAFFRRLSVFAGGWTLVAAEAVVDASLAPDVLDLLSRLVDKSLVTVRGRGRSTRYGMLELIREYGLERLARSGEAAEVRRRHAEHFLAEAEAASGEIGGAKAAERLELFEKEHDNVRAALGWQLEHDPDSCLRLATAVSQSRVLRGHLAEARQWLEAALSRALTAPASVRVSALLQAGAVAATQGDIRAARAFYEQGISIAGEGATALQRTLLVFYLGEVALMEGNVRAARAYYAESLVIARETGNDLLIASSLNSVGEADRLEGAWDSAKEFYEKAVAAGRLVGNEPFLNMALCNLGAVECERGELDAASGFYREAFAIARALRSDEYVGLSLDGLGAIAAKRGEWARAARLAGAADALLAAIGAKLGPADRAFRDRYLAEARERLGAEAAERAFADGYEMPLEQAVEYALGRE
jgi:non-specific serine/threonine protein kinase